MVLNGHIADVKNKIAKGFGIILRARKFFNRKTLLNLYHAFIFPYLICCVETWGNVRDIHLLPIIILQRKIVRAITFFRYLAHTAEKSLRMCSMRDKVSFNTRNKHELRAAYGKHNFMYSNFCIVGIKIWNYITVHLDTNITLLTFKKFVKFKPMILSYLYVSLVSLLSVSCCYIPLH